MGSIASRTECVAVIAASAHEVEVTHAEPTAIGGVVEVGEAHAVTEFVAETANALDGTTGSNLIAASIGVDGHSIECQLAACAFFQRVHVGPDSRCGTTVGLTLAGIEHKHLVYLTVAIPVVVSKVHFAVCLLACFFDHLFGIHVVALAVVLSVVALIVLHGVRTYYVEIELELACTLILEVVGHRASERAFAVSLLIHDSLVFHVSELCQDHNALLRSEIVGTVAHAHLLPR